MKTLLIAGLSALLLGSVSSPVVAQATNNRCIPRANALSQLDAQYKERPVSIGLAATGAVVEVLASETGTWTILLTTPQGVSCVIAVGNFWEDLPKTKAAIKGFDS